MVQSPGTQAREASRRRPSGVRSGTGEQPARHGATDPQSGSAGSPAGGLCRPGPPEVPRGLPETRPARKVLPAGTDGVGGERRQLPNTCWYRRTLDVFILTATLALGPWL